jgi:hypothetical protein
MRALGRLITRGSVATSRVLNGGATLMRFIGASALPLADLKSGASEYWDSFYSRESDIESGLMPWERAVVEKWVQPGSRLLLVGSGTGRDMIELVRYGCSVTGIEPSDAIEVSRAAMAARGLPCTLMRGYFEDLDLPGRFDTVLFSYYAYTFVPMSRRRVDALRRAATLLADDGCIIVSYPWVARAREDARRPDRRISVALAHACGALTAADWRLEPGDHIRLARISPPAFYFWHDTVPEELDAEVAAAGLRIVDRKDPPDAPVAVIARPR